MLNMPVRDCDSIVSHDGGVNWISRTSAGLRTWKKIIITKKYKERVN
jgi:hypothetical protein